jgi:Glucodextranase, domain B
MATLPLTNVTAADAGSYTATATNTIGSATTPAGTLTVVTAPVLNALNTYTAGTSSTLTWPAVTAATGYTVQIATSSDFITGLNSQTVTTSSATFTGLTSGTLYYYRATSTYNAASTPYSNTVSSTQDATTPLVAITTSSGSTTHSSLQVRGTASSAGSGLASVTVNGVTATLTSGTWSATVPLNLGTNTTTAMATSNAGSTATASITLMRSASTQNDGLPDSWKTANNIPLTNAPVNGPLGDLDSDGHPNLLEYAFNTNPQANDSNPFQCGAVTKAGDGLKYLEISYPRRIGALDLVYTVEVSDDLTTWPLPGTNTEPVSIVPKGDGITETVTIRVLPAITSAAKKFARVRVTTQ